MVKYINESINNEEITENENPEKVVNIVEKILDFNKQQKGKGIKILTPKQLLQRVPIAIAQVKGCNTSENLLNEIRKSYILFIEKKKLLKKYKKI